MSVQLHRLSTELQKPADLLTGRLEATLQLANLRGDTGEIVLPSGITSAILEIGCSDFETADEQYMAHPKHNHTFLLSFEPLIDKYAILLARGTKRFHGEAKDRSVPLGQHHQRGVVLPFAVTPHGGPIDFSVGMVAGCSSMLPIANARAAAAAWCGQQMQRRRVPSISLETAIGMLGPTLPISRLKIDAQGADFELLRAAPFDLLQRRVRVIELETRSPTCPPLYQGQSMCDEVFTYMTSIGYLPTGRTERDSPYPGCPPGRNASTGKCTRPMGNFYCCEQNMVYARA